MKFKWARCVCCKNYFANSSLLVAFRRVCRSDNDPCRLELEIVDLCSQESWHSLMVICVDCLDLLWEVKKGFRREDRTTNPGSDTYVPNIEG